MCKLLYSDWADCSCIVVVFKVNADPDLDDEHIVIPTASMYGSGGHRVSHTSGDDDDGFDDFWD